VLLTALASLAILSIPCVLVGASGRALWRRTPPVVRWRLRHPASFRRPGGRAGGDLPWELPRDWWEQFERDFRAYASKHRRPG
jgi:hypothetical protein